MAAVLEVCVGSVSSAVNAQLGGADRVELCSNLLIGGTTPGLHLAKQVRYHTDLKIRVLLRPRFGDFCYDRYELEQMADEAAEYAALGVDAIVTGMLTPDCHLDLAAMSGSARPSAPPRWPSIGPLICAGTRSGHWRRPSLWV